MIVARLWLQECAWQALQKANYLRGLIAQRRFLGRISTWVTVPFAGRVAA